MFFSHRFLYWAFRRGHCILCCTIVLDPTINISHNVFWILNVCSSGEKLFKPAWPMQSFILRQKIQCIAIFSFLTAIKPHGACKVILNFYASICIVPNFVYTKSFPLKMTHQTVCRIKSFRGLQYTAKWIFCESSLTVRGLWHNHR